MNKWNIPTYIEGNISIDEINLNQIDISSFRKIGYVSQEVHLFDDSIKKQFSLKR